MITNIQQMIYEELQSQILQYKVYTCPCDTMQIPYILIRNITTSSLPYSQEIHKYTKIDMLITIYNKPYTNKDCLQTLDRMQSIINSLLRNLNNISNISITIETHHNEKSFSGDLKLSFYYIS